MTATDIVQKDGLMLIRNRKEDHEKGTAWNYDVKEAFTGKKTGWVYLDSFTLSALKAVYNAMSEENKAKYDTIHINRLIDFSWKFVK
jgi:hypothetical protein